MEIPLDFIILSIGLCMKNKSKPTVLTRIETILMNIFSALKVNINDYCDLETTDGAYNIVLKNGALLSLIEYDGTRTIVSNEVFRDHITRLTTSLQVFLQNSGHQFGMVFKRDLNATSDLFRIAEIQKTTAANLDLRLEFLIDEAVEVYSQYVYDETNIIVMITHPKLLDPTEQAMESKRKMQMAKEYELPSMQDAQSILLANSYLKSQHDTYVERVLSELAHPEFAAQANRLNVAEALRQIKKSVSPLTTDANWTPYVPNSVRHIPLRWKHNPSETDASHVLWQELPTQIMRQAVISTERLGGEYPVSSVITENRIYAPLLVDVPPQLEQPFSVLFDSLNNATTTLPNGRVRALPFCITFMISGDGFAGGSIKRTLANILAVASAQNANIKAAAESLQGYDNAGGTVVGLSISMMTWAENNAFGKDEIQIRRSKLWRIVESWGGAQVMEKGGDPILGWTSNIPGLNIKHHAPKCPAPLWEALHMLPWTRQASPFKMGTIMNRSVDGKLMKLEAFSSEQTTWITIYVGKPGSGKSVAMNNDILESCLMPGLSRLPLIFMVDVGISSRGPIELIQDHLPREKSHLAVYKRLRNDKRNAINPLDIAVGRMTPMINELAQMVAFVTTLVTPVEANGKAVKGMSNFVTSVIEQTFINKMDGDERGTPNRYETNNDLELDELMFNAGIDPFNKSYFQLVHECHNKKVYRARDLCHRYAMPVLQDVSATVNSQEIKTRYGNAVTDTGELFIDVFTRGIQEAIVMYPVFCENTRFDLDVARVVSLDLQDVIGTNPKQSSLFFQIARIFAKRKMAFTIDDIPLFPENFRAYYTRLIEEISEDKKILAYDELHNAKKDDGLFAELERDCREARKWGMELKFASQIMEDFGRIPELATRFVIADRGTPKARQNLRETIELKEVEEAVLKDYVKLGPGGLTYLSRIVGKNGSYVSLMTLTVGPQRLWALTTDADDRLLRTNIYDLLGDRPLALRLLAKAYPFGAKKVINMRKESLRANAESGEDIDRDEEMNSITRTMAQELINDMERLLA